MKTKILSLCALFAISTRLLGQSADTLVSQGRGFLVQRDAVNAKARFEFALALSPNHPDANALLAVARLLSLANTPEGSALLDRLGMGAAGRNPFNWQSDLPRDANGGRVLPANFSVSELSAFLRTNVIPALRASETNLSRITNASYLLMLSRAETGSDNVIVDYGDIQMLRALLQSAQCGGLSVYSWNLDLQLRTIQNYVTNQSTTIQDFLAANPQLLTFATTNDLLSARAAFLAAAERYFAASELIRSRPQNTARLFDLDLDSVADEAIFRQTLLDLTNSLASPVVVVNYTNLTIHLAKPFSGETAPRSLFPSFYGNGFLIGSLPDPTFGGVVQGWSRASTEELLARYLDPVQPVTGILLQSPRRFSVGFPTLTNHSYAVERSTNIVHWESVADFRASGSNYNYTDSTMVGGPAAYYRVVDLAQYLSIEGRVVDACSGLPISNATITTTSDPNLATTDATGKFFLQTGMRPGFQFFDVVALAPGHILFQRSFYAREDISDLVVALSPGNSPSPGNDQFANRIVLSGPNPSGAGTTCGATHEPGEPGSGNSVWWAWTAPFSGNAQIRVETDGIYFGLGVSAYTGGSLGSLVQVSSPYLFVTAGETYQLSFSSAGGAAGFRFSISGQPTVAITSPTNWSTFATPATVPFLATFTSPSSTLREARFYASGNLIGTVTNTPISFVWSNMPPNSYNVTLEAEDSNGQKASAFEFITVRPGNDNFADRIPLSGAAFSAPGDNTGATMEAGEPQHGGGFGGRSIWWSWTAPTDGPVTVIANGDNYNASSLGVYTGITVSNLSLVVSNSGTQHGSQASFNAVAGSTYQIAVAGFGQGPMELSIPPAGTPRVSITSPTNGQVFFRGQTIMVQATASDSDGTIQNVSFKANGKVLGGDALPPYEWLLTTATMDGSNSVSATALDDQGLVGYSSQVFFRVVLPPPANDHFTNRLQLTGSSLTATGYTFSATKEIGEPNHGGDSGGASAWWQWTPTTSGLAVVSTSGSTFDTLLGIYQGSNVGNLSLVSSNNNYGYFGTSRVMFPVAAGANYQIAVDGSFGTRGNIALNISVPTTSASLTDALDTTNLVWTGGAVSWSAQSLTTHDGFDAAQSGLITHNQETWMESIISGPGTGSFWWTVSSEYWDFLSFEIDGVAYTDIRGTPAWSNQAFTLGAGTHTLRWRYKKDSSNSAGLDRGWVDQLIFTPSP